MYFIYTTVLGFLLPFVLIRLFWLGRHNTAYRQRWAERLGYAPAATTAKPLVWIHAVSVGEIQVSRPLVQHIRDNYPQYGIIISTVTPTGEAAARQIYGSSVEHRYLPYDLPFALSRFLRIIRPRVLLVLETEIWPNLYRQCKAAGIPVLLLNARLSEKSLKGYRIFSSLTRDTLNSVSVIAAQSTADADRFIAAGAPPDRVMVMGNLKFDITIPPSVVERAEVIRRQFSVNRPVWIAASTHQGEEQIVLDAMTRVLEKVPDSLLIIAPRHPERFQTVSELCVKSGFTTACYTDPGSYDTGTQVLILDILGQLPAYYAAADVTFVGGSLVPVGGHNMLEPSCVGVPVITGPHLFNFTEIARLLDQVDALIRVENATRLAEEVVRLFADANLRFNIGQRAKQVVLENQGSINRVVALLRKYL